MKIKFPQEVIEKFILEARKNTDTSEKSIETLCYFLGDQNESDSVVVDTIVFPEQTATATHVNDDGKLI